MFLALCPFVINKLTPLNPNMWQPLVYFPSFYTSAFPRMSYEWNYIEWSPLCLASFSSQDVFEMYPCCRIQQRFAPLILFIGHVYHRLCDCSSAPLLKKIWVVSSTKLWCLKHSCTGFCVNISFHFSRVTWQVHVELYKKLPNCFPEWLYHFTFPPWVEEGSGCSVFWLALGIVNRVILTKGNWPHFSGPLMAHHCTGWKLSFSAGIQALLCQPPAYFFGPSFPMPAPHSGSGMLISDHYLILP